LELFGKIFLLYPTANEEAETEQHQRQKARKKMQPSSAKGKKPRKGCIRAAPTAKSQEKDAAEQRKRQKAKKKMQPQHIDIKKKDSLLRNTSGD